MSDEKGKFIGEVAPAVVGGVLFVILFCGFIYIEGLVCRWIGFDFIDKTSVTYNTLLMGTDTIQLGFIFAIIINLIIAWSVTKNVFGKKTAENHFDEMNKKLFPGGEKQINQGAKEIMKLSSNKLNLKKSFKLFCGVSYLFATAEDKSEDRMIGYINKKTDNRLNKAEAKAILEFVIKK
jgi:hypothetical protein